MNQYDQEDEGADGIIHPIDQPLEVGDFIEIQGISRGGIVLIELLAETVAPNDATEVLPLQLTLMTGGPMSILSRNHNVLERNECFMKHGLRAQLQFELCIFVREKDFEIRVNRETVATQKHVIPPGDIKAIGMYGNAEFTSIEFKDIHGDDDYSDSYQPPSGFVRVQELRESQQRKKGSPVLVRTSTRRSFKDVKAAQEQWKTSSDLTKPDLDVDTPNVYANVAAKERSGFPQGTASRYPEEHTYTDVFRADSFDKKHGKGLKIGGSRKSLNLDENKFDDQYIIGGAQSNVLAGNVNRGSYHLIDDENLVTKNMTDSTATVPNRSSKRSSLFSWRKSKGSSSDLKGSQTDVKPKRSSIFSRHKKSSESDLRGAASMPSMMYAGESMPQIRSQPALNSLYLGAASDRAPTFGELPKTVTKESSPEIAAYVAAQRAVPEFEDFSLTTERDRLFIGSWAPQGAVTENAPVSDEKDRKLEGPAPLMADVLYEQRRSGFDPELSLTGGVQPVDKEPYNVQGSAVPLIMTKSEKPGEKNLKGTAPEIASTYDDYFKSTNKYPPQEDISGLGQQISKPKITNQSKPTYEVSYQISAEKTHTQKAGRKPSFGSQSEGSTVHTDDEYYLDVGTSGYYMERKRSLKSYQSRRTRKNDKNARKSMGFADSDGDSSDSSISFLKPDDPTITPHRTRRQPRSDASKVNSWLDDGSRETKIHPVYAAAPTQAERLSPGLKLDSLQLRRSLFDADLPVSLGAGRLAELWGRFLENEEKKQTCRIRLSTEADQPNSHYSMFIVEISSDGNMRLSGLKPDDTWDTQDGAKSSGVNKFNLKFYIQELVLLVTLDNEVTLMLKELDRSMRIKNVSLEDCTNAELDNLTVSSTMLLPLNLFYPESVQACGQQSLTLRTKLTADCARLKMEFKIKTIALEERFDIVLNFEQYILQVESAGNCVEGGKQAIIPFVPEQVKEIRVETRPEGASLKVLVNQQELLQQTLPFKLLCTAPDCVRIDGDFVLLETKFE